MELTIAYYGRQLNDDELVASPRNRNSMDIDSEKNEYPYSESDAPKMLDKFLEEGLIELSQSKRPEELKEPMIPNTTSIIGSSTTL